MKKNSELIKKVSEAFAKGDIEFAEKYFSEDMHWNIIGEEPIKGKEQILEIYKMSQLESFPIVTIKNMIAEGNYVVTESLGKAVTKNGKPYNQTYCDVFRFENNKLQEITTYLDTALSKKVLN